MSHFRYSLGLSGLPWRARCFFKAAGVPGRTLVPQCWHWKEQDQGSTKLKSYYPCQLALTALAPVLMALAPVMMVLAQALMVMAPVLALVRLVLKVVLMVFAFVPTVPTDRAGTCIYSTVTGTGSTDTGTDLIRHSEGSGTSADVNEYKYQQYWLYLTHVLKPTVFAGTCCLRLSSVLAFFPRLFLVGRQGAFTCFPFFSSARFSFLSLAASSTACLSCSVSRIGSTVASALLNWCIKFKDIGYNDPPFLDSVLSFTVLHTVLPLQVLEKGFSVHQSQICMQIQTSPREDCWGSSRPASGSSALSSWNQKRFQCLCHSLSLSKCDFLTNLCRRSWLRRHGMLGRPEQVNLTFWHFHYFFINFDSKVYRIGRLRARRIGLFGTAPVEGVARCLGDAFFGASATLNDYMRNLKTRLSRGISMLWHVWNKWTLHS